MNSLSGFKLFALWNLNSEYDVAWNKNVFKFCRSVFFSSAMSKL